MPSRNVTVPVAGPAVPAVAEAVNVALEPKTEGFGDDATVTVVPFKPTTCATVADVLALRIAVAVNVAVMECVATESDEVTIEALPAASKATVVSAVTPSKNVTEPDGIPVPGATVATSASNRTAAPEVVGFDEEANVVVVDARLTTSESAAEVLGAAKGVPANEAVIGWLVTVVNGKVKNACPAVLRFAVPSHVAPSKNVTVPNVGVGTAAIVAVNVGDCP